MKIAFEKSKFLIFVDLNCLKIIKKSKTGSSTNADYNIKEPPWNLS